MEQRVPRPCHNCFYDVSASADSGFTQCPECGALIIEPNAPIPLRRINPVASALFLGVSLIPSVVIFEMLFYGGGPDPVLVAIWLCFIALIHVANIAFERRRSPTECHDRAALRTLVIVGLHFFIPIAVIVIVATIVE